jgi:hypothetical protein
MGGGVMPLGPRQRNILLLLKQLGADKHWVKISMYRMGKILKAKWGQTYIARALVGLIMRGYISKRYDGEHIQAGCSYRLVRAGIE